MTRSEFARFNVSPPSVVYSSFFGETHPIQFDRLDHQFHIVDHFVHEELSAWTRFS